MDMRILPLPKKCDCRDDLGDLDKRLCIALCYAFRRHRCTMMSTRYHDEDYAVPMTADETSIYGTSKTQTFPTVQRDQALIGYFH